jgi:uncharacterized membrane protein AbrB (regulator of aidB expression)
MVVGILAVCFWSHAWRRSTAGEKISVPDRYRLIAFALVGIGLAFTVAKGAFPSTKEFLDFVLHCLPLVMSYLVWSMWKENEVAPL